VDWLQTLYVCPLYTAALMSVVLALLARRHRSTPGTGAFIALMLGAGWWALAYAFSLLDISQTAKFFWFRIRAIGFLTVPNAWLVLALLQSGNRKWVTKRNIALLLIEPLAILLLIWTSDWQTAYWEGVGFAQIGPFSVVDVTPSILYYVHLLYAYLLMALGAVLFLRMALRLPSLYRRQSLVLVIGVLAPLIGDVLSSLELLPILPWLDLTPFFFVLTGLAMSWALFRLRLLDLVPVARDAIFRSMSDGVIVLDADDRIVDLNPVAEGIVDCPASEAIGEPAQQVLSRWPDLVERYGRIAETHTEIAVGEGVVRRCFDLRISPLRDWRRRLTGRLIVLRDITARKSMEEELQTAKEAAETANQAKNEFITLVAHELRSPMSAIEGSASLLAEQEVGPITEEQAEFLDIIESNISRMSTLVSDLNDISLIESGRLHLLMDLVSLAEIVNEVVRSNRVQIRRKHLRLNLDISPDLPPVWGDRHRLEQVLTNIVVNAWKFTPEGGEITIRAKCDSDGLDDRGTTEVIHVSVADTGLGIDPRDQAKIFQKYFRAGTKQAREIPGTGLGLSLAKDIVEMQGGKIWFESEYREGTTFHFTVPLAKDNQ
jgi:PAS domain S-box-containing protein